MKKIYYLSFMLTLHIIPTLVYGQPFSIIKDINSKSIPAISSDPMDITDVNGIMYFSSAGEDFGRELWKTDGTVTGTTLVKDINPGLGDANPILLTAMNGALYFIAKDPTNGQALWKSDGTLSGTVLIRKFDFVQEMAVVNGVLYISGIVYGEGEPGNQLWKSDGSTEGTVYIKNIDLSAQQLTDFNGILYFRGSVGAANNALGKSDGTAQGTVVVKSGVNPSLLTVSNGELFFKGDSGVTGSDLWKSDGTETGTVIVKDIPSLGFSGTEMVDINGILYFEANDGVSGEDLWKSDGTEQGTILVKNFLLNASSVAGPKSLTNVNGTLFFSLNENTYGRELWKSDGTEAGTVIVKDIYPGQQGSINGAQGILNTSYFTSVNGLLYFVASGQVGGIDKGYELWKSDGTEMGTSMVKDISKLTNQPAQLTNVAGLLYFTADNDTTGRLVWKSDGTEQGTIPLKNLNGSIAGSSEPVELTNVNGILTFVASDGIGGNQLWKTDGTAGNAIWFGSGSPDYYPDYNNISPSRLRASGNSLYFVAGGHDEFDNATAALYISDLQVAYQEYGPPSYPIQVPPSNLTDVNGTLYFVANAGYDVGFEVMQTNGQGASVLADIKQGNDFGSPECPGGPSCINIAPPGELVNINGVLYFSAFDDDNGYQIWKSDGGAPSILKPGVNGNSLTNVGGTLYFFTNKDLWVSNGFEEGTQFLKSFAPFLGAPTLININGVLFFSLKRNNNLNEVWKSDGTADGTVLVKSFSNNTFSEPIQQLTNVNGLLFFTAKSDDSGVELWKSNGTEQGTQLVKDIVTGEESSQPYALSAMGNQLLFRASDGIHGDEIWRSDGTANGTFMIQDAEPGPAGSNPQYLNSTTPNAFVEVNGKVFTSIKTTTYGTELWVANDLTNVCPANTGRLYVNASVANSGSGSSWSCAIKELRDAVNIANADTSIKEIWVAAGVYKPTAGTDQTISITITRNNLKVMGGFSGVETQLSEANPQNNRTTISGDIGIQDDMTDNSYFILRIANADSDANSLRVDGFVIEKGYSSGPGLKK